MAPGPLACDAQQYAGGDRGDGLWAFGGGVDDFDTRSVDSPPCVARNFDNYHATGDGAQTFQRDARVRDLGVGYDKYYAYVACREAAGDPTGYRPKIGIDTVRRTTEESG